MEQSPSLETNNYLASKEITHLYGNQNFIIVPCPEPDGSSPHLHILLP
jgi:hypothetical protein